MIEKRQFYINGQWVDPVTAHDFDVIDPSTEDVLGVISLGGQADTDAAVAAAKAAFPSWSQTSKGGAFGALRKTPRRLQSPTGRYGRSHQPGNGRTAKISS
jgi:aldehyde dehydrogenase (NAD+)